MNFFRSKRYSAIQWEWLLQIPNLSIYNCSCTQNKGYRNSTHRGTIWLSVRICCSLYCRFVSLHFTASLFLFMKMPCISQSECHVAPPPQPLPNFHLHMNLLHAKVTPRGNNKHNTKLHHCSYITLITFLLLQ